ncbi:methyltransferase [Pseudidiomarina sp. YC-516-91]|uniref:methyltransferase n=1 Tax=Pseudidiomarina salilacus TaxID=3384452 RepID=UPI0039851468
MAKLGSALTPPSQLVLRHAQQFTGAQLLAVNPPDEQWRSELDVVASWHLHAGWFRAWQHLGAAHVFAATAPQTTATAAVLWLPKEKKLTDYLLQALAGVLPSGAKLWIVGEKRSGIKSIHKHIGTPWTPPQKIADGHHSTLLCCELTQQQSPVALSDFCHYSELAQPGLAALKLASYPGVFAFPSIDEGSRMLLQHLPTLGPGKLLDFACGHGVLGAWLQRQQPQLQVSYLDVSAMALAACAETLRCNGLTGELIAADELSTTLPSYDTIVSHPPFHTGQKTDYSIGQQFLRSAREHLTSNGELWLVANRFLPWPELITDSFGHCERVAQDNKFAVYRARRGRR